MDKAAAAFTSRQAQSDIAQLNIAEGLVRDAFGRVQDPNASAAERTFAEKEMSAADLTFQQMASKVPRQVGREIQQADQEQQQVSVWLSPGTRSSRWRVT